MKLLHSFLLLSLACLGSLQAQTPVVGTELEIGPTGSNQVWEGYGESWYCGAIGKNNSVWGDGSLAVGDANTIGFGFLAVGTYNSATWGGTGALFGFGNSVNGSSLNCVLVGTWNQTSSMDGPPDSTMLVGIGNFAESAVSASLVVGKNNTVGGSYATTGIFYDPVESSTTLGHGLWNYWNYATIVGCYNDTTFTTPLLFAVGNGTDATHRSNALEVYADGKIKMPRQGDILMGEFGNPE